MEIGNLVEDTYLEATDKIDQTELHVDQTESLHTHKPLNDQPSRFFFYSLNSLFRCFGSVHTTLSLSYHPKLLFRPLDSVSSLWLPYKICGSRTPAIEITGTLSDCHRLAAPKPPPTQYSQPLVPAKVTRFVRFSLPPQQFPRSRK